MEFRTNHLNDSSLPLVRLRLAQLSSHLVVALVALVVIGGATRVMEAGLACPDWPLCYGSFFPGSQMNIQVFLEWFHRLDAFLVGIALLVQFVVALRFKSKLPDWLIWMYGFLLLLVVLQAGLGALTVLNLLPSVIVTAHLVLALTLVALMSAISQRLLQSHTAPVPTWWKHMGLGSLLLVIAQALIGGRMSSTWASKKCLIQGDSCLLLDLHRMSAIPITLFILIFLSAAVLKGGWFRRQWPFLGFIAFLLFIQIGLGITSVQFGLSLPAVTVAHQLVGSLLVGSLAALTARRPNYSEKIVNQTSKESILEACHG